MSDMSSQPRSVKIGDNERTGWSSERPRRPGAAERPPRRPDVSVRGRVLSPTDSLRYSPGSLLLIACPDATTRGPFSERVLTEKGALLTLGKIRTLLRGKVAEGELDEKAHALLENAAAKRLAAGQTVVIALETLDAEERERYVQAAAAAGRPRHLILVEAGRERLSDEDKAALGELRTALDAGAMGQEGFATSLRLSGAAVAELKRIVFAPPPRDD